MARTATTRTNSCKPIFINKEKVYIMQLQNNLQTKSGWEIFETSFNADQLSTTGSNFMIGNGYLGYRGTPAEWTSERFVACIVSDTYDAAIDGWRELCNAPNGLFTALFINGKKLSLFEGQTQAFHRTLDMQHGLYQRAQRWESPAGKQIEIEVEKFASFENVHLLAMQYAFKPTQTSQVKLITGIDGKVWELKGEHFKTYRSVIQDELIGIETVTREQNIQIDVVEGLAILGATPKTTENIQTADSTMRQMTFNLEAGHRVTLQKVVAIYTSNDCPAPRKQAVADVQSALQAGYPLLKDKHQKQWSNIWQAADVRIAGHLEDQTIARFNLYQNIIATPRHADLPIGARGLSCQVYQGAAFWDQELFNLPVFLYTEPQIARSILKYRYDTLDGARKKAQSLGYYGAFYAWTSGKTGEELFPDHFFTDVISGRKVRNHFNDWQIHISPDIVFAVWQYYIATGDWDFIVDFGAEIVFEVAQFLVSHVYFKKDKGRFEFIRLLGPDEYHENVDNNAFTNYMARFALEKAIAINEQMQRDAPKKRESLLNRLALGPKDIQNWQEIASLVYLPQPDGQSRLIEEFDGYFKLEDATPETLQQRLMHPDEYWGWPNGVAVETQVLKQADVLQLFVVLDDFPTDVIRANFDYYEPRTEHGSSLSPSVHSQIASEAGYPQMAYSYFKQGATIDLYNSSKKVNSGGSFLGGIHTAACGGTWLMLVRGFAGFRLDDNGVINLSPALPEMWEGLSFRLEIRGNRLEVNITRDNLRLTAEESNTGALTVRVHDQTVPLQPGEVQNLP
jgi:kojibiose phosphorylase